MDSTINLCLDERYNQEINLKSSLNKCSTHFTHFCEFFLPTGVDEY